MTDIQPRNPLLGLLRLLALIWVGFSLLGIVIGVLAVVYAGAYGCVDHAQGWFACTAATGLLPLSALGSLFTATIVLIFAQLFYAAGARVRDVPLPRRRTLREKARDSVVDAVVDIFD